MNIYIFLAIINLITFLLYFIDKRKAISGSQRISEQTLLLFSFLFGSLGALLGMYICHHKTKKFKFKILVPLFFIIHCVALYYLKRYFPTV
ncbi:Uncharacterized membrane protein YsdA, DUF1294 family [Peptoniphilus asaccharolyticus DSM 20463]|uniref:Uncharacterized membrane protein YsdA, DUF1294 family n=1 Tax=Peptoniphilus asaccharolyticus DSM 20463 TaxID=573058 RepID=A0A1W1VHM3_PEPAS|nr:DUF1294 domain-containing protein [Peptoniphilus asaccharolyticus]MBL7574314.1 DUF1294 domain-containing protein [Peptoniphilus asaccharolyticus]SMB92885.1 Uncharacterized membrane protein YsdA, DUF1294 family [Peptoniphilus asaccharolyticus DSM 20463]